MLWLVVFAWPALADDNNIISADQAWQLSEAGELVLIDIRTEAEWRETGVPVGARRASLFNGDGFPNSEFLDEVRNAAGGDPSRPVALICAGGVRSSLARAMLEAEGFQHVYDVGEGMLGSGAGPGWLPRELPVEPCGDCPQP